MALHNSRQLRTPTRQVPIQSFAKWLMENFLTNYIKDNDCSGAEHAHLCQSFIKAPINAKHLLPLDLTIFLFRRKSHQKHKREGGTQKTHPDSRDKIEIMKPNTQYKKTHKLDRFETSEVLPHTSG